MNLKSLLDPVTVDQFKSVYWDRAHLHIKSAPKKTKALPDIHDIPGMMAGKIIDGRWLDTHNLFAQAYRTNQEGKTEKFYKVSIDMYAELFNSGFGLCFNDVSHAIPDFQELLRDFSIDSVSSNDSVTCYLTPPNSRGLLHFDNQHVFFIQKKGRKNWRVSLEPAIKYPFENLIFSDIEQNYLDHLSEKGYSVKTPVECGYVDLVLEEGDILYMPPGHYHLGHTTDDESLHYTLTIAPITFHTQAYSEIYEKSRRESSVVNKDIRFLSQAEVKENIESSRRVYKDIISGSFLENLKQHGADLG